MENQGYLKWRLLLSCLLLSVTALSADEKRNTLVGTNEVFYQIENCLPESKLENFFHKGMFYPDGDLNARGLAYLQPLEVIGRASLESYNLDSRLENRFFISSSGDFKAPIKKYFRPSIPFQPDVNLKREFLVGLLRQMEEAIDKDYAQWVSYLDMGHVHLNLPKDVLKEARQIKTTKEPGKDSIFQSFILDHPDVLALFHVAEKVDFYLGSKSVIPEQKNRFLSRNLLGKPYEEQSLQVVVADVEGKVWVNTFNLPGDHNYREAGESIYFQGNKNGCFQLQTKNGQINFDMSFKMPSSDPEVERAYRGQ